MVRIRDFRGALFSPNDYQQMLASNLQHLESIPMSKTFCSAEAIKSGVLTSDSSPAYYVYRQINEAHVSLGLLVEASIQDYRQKKILPHQKTLKRKGLDRHSYKREHVGPVVLAHRSCNRVEQLLRSTTEENQPYAEWITVDGRHHAIWRVTVTEVDFISEMAAVDLLYVLDGHHRLEAAYQNYIAEPELQTSDQWIQALIYSSKYIKVEPQHRILSCPLKPSHLSTLASLPSVKLAPISLFSKEHRKEHDVVCCIGETYFGLDFLQKSNNLMETIPTFRLQEEIIKKMFNTEEINNMTYMPEINKKTLAHVSISFFIPAPSIEKIFQLAENNLFMPPKSTWIQPKPCSHMVMRIMQ